MALVALIGNNLIWYRLYPFNHREAIFRHAQANDLDPFLVAAVIRVESKFNPDATSGRGARGLMQLMPDTGRWVAEKLNVKDFRPESLYDPDANIRFGTWYLAELRRQFSGDIILALAAYNGGEGNVQRWLNNQQWTGEHSTLEQIPFKETREFVARVLTDFERYQRLYGQLDDRR